MRDYLAVALVLMLSGCNAAYQRSTFAPGGTASLRFNAPQKKGINSQVSLYAHKGEDCGFAPKKVVGLGGMFNVGGGNERAGDIGITRDPRLVYTRGQYFETTVGAGERFSFTAVGGELGYGVCHVTASFVPEAGAEYEITYTTEYDQCVVRVDRIGMEEAGFVRHQEDSMLQRPTSCTHFWN